MLRDFFTFHTLIAFLLGVFLSGWVMSLIHSTRSKVAG
jgi:hypothetical protein